MKRIFFGLLVFVFGCSCSFAFEERDIKIVSLAPSTTEILFALGLDKEIVGVSSFCNYPPEARKKQKIGTFSQPNIEKILSLKPDIILCTGLEQAPVIVKLKQLGLRVHVSDPSNIEELFDSIRKVAALTGRKKEANELIKNMKAGVEYIRSKTESIPIAERPKVFIEFWNDPLMTAGRGSFIDELITLAGGINISRDIGRPYSYFSPEQVIKRDPDCIILAYMVNKDAAKAIRGRLGWKGITAVRKNRIYNDINPDILLRSTPRLVRALAELHKRLYP